MKKLSAVVIVASIASSVFAADREKPKGWNVNGAPAERYLAIVERSSAIEGKACGILSADTAEDHQFGTLTQAIHAGHFAGKRVRLSAQIKTQNAGKAWLWLRADRQDGAVLAFDNMHDRLLKGTTDWAIQTIVLDIPQEAHALAFGLGLGGAGKAWLDAVNFELVPNNIETTRSIRAPAAKKPMPKNALAEVATNLNFEQ